MKSYKYVEYLLRRKCFPDFIKALKFKNDLKEWTECVGMLHVVYDFINHKKIDTIFDIGCGKRPTLGTLVALNLKDVKVICIDPQLDTSLASNIKGMELRGEPLMDYINIIKDLEEIPFKNAMICCNHSHVSKKEIYKLIVLCNYWIYITNPCCVDNKLARGYYKRDRHIWSPKNEIFTFLKDD